MGLENSNGLVSGEEQREYGSLRRPRCLASRGEQRSPRVLTHLGTTPSSFGP